jgi:hypothetical protein
MFESTGVRRRTVLAGCGGLCVAALGGCTVYGPAGPAASPAPAPVPPPVPGGEGSVLAAVADVLRWGRPRRSGRGSHPAGVWDVQGV